MPSQQQISTTPTDARDEWRTPRFVFEFWARRFAFDVDLAATVHNTLCQDWIDRETNSLEADWAGIGQNVGWLNPPYSGVEPWLEKARAEAMRGFTTVALLPTANGQLIYGRQVFGVASEVWFISGRLSFLDSSGKPRAGNTSGSMVAVYRAYDLGDTRYGHIWRHHMEADWRQCQAAAEVARLKQASIVPGVMHCAKCNFELTRVTLYMGNGAVGPGDSNTEPCPNGCGPMWPVTWESRAREQMAVAERFFDEKQKAEAELAALREKSGRLLDELDEDFLEQSIGVAEAKAELRDALGR